MPRSRAKEIIMKIVVIGGTGLIGSKLVNKLREHGHEAVAAAPNTGVNTLTLPHLDERSTHRSGPFPPGAFCCTPINSTATRSVTLVPMPAFPTHGYSRHLFGEISSPGTEGFSS